MRVSRLSRLSAISLLLISVAMTGTLVWTLSKLHQSNEAMQQFGAIKQQVAVQLVRSIDDYLASGDALKLSEAEALLVELKEQQLVTLDKQIAEESIAAVDQLLLNLQGRYRALGKLSGNELGLLLNAERELGDYAESAVEYGAEALQGGKRGGADYIDAGTAIFDNLQSLAVARERFFKSGAEMDRNALIGLLRELQQTAQSVDRLPLLGIFLEEEEDEFALGDDDEEGEDKAEEFSSELSSLASRYPRELQRTMSLIDQRAATSKELQAEVDGVVAAINRAEQPVLEARDAAFSQAKWTMYLASGILVLFALLNMAALSALVLKPLRGLRDAFRQLVDTGEFHPIEVKDEKTELGEIASCFNQLLQQLEDDSRRKQEQLELVSNTLIIMDSQVQDITRTSEETEQQVAASRDVMEQLSELTSQLSQISAEVEHNASETQGSMDISQQGVEQMMRVTEETNVAIQSGLGSLDQLNEAVDNVTNILDVIRNIAEQTNLLALNAAIESARAGEHGRGFSVVADEVRKLSHKTQEQVSEISQFLEQLGETSSELSHNISGISEKSENQQQVAGELMQTAEKVRLKAQANAEVAHQASEFAQQQQHYVGRFAQAMDHVQQQVEESRQLSLNIERDVRQQAENIESTLRN